MNTAADRRRHSRLPAALLVQHQSETDGQFQVDYASDLSVGGLFIRTDRPLPIGSPLQVQFAPSKDSTLVQAYCKVARVTHEGMAAQFLRIDPESAATLRRVLPA